MEHLYQEHINILNNFESTFRRGYIDQIDWDERLTAIKGPRGIGKTTLILQYITEKYGMSEEALYISMDSIALRNLSIYEIAKHHINHGGTHLFIDEIHKYPNWSQEIKSIYDQFRKLKVVVTSSSILQIYKGNYDLSRRMVSFDMHGLSFREYLQIVLDVQLPVLSLKDITENHVDFAIKLSKNINILPHLRDYLKHGYYPFFLESTKSYVQKLNNTINLILDIDLPYVLGINVHNIFKVKKLLSNLATQVPFQPNITKMAGSLELTRSTINQYIHYLENACLLNLLVDAGKSYSSISKPEKVYLNNTNLSYAISIDNVDIGNMRETFFYNQVDHVHEVHYSKAGDFLVNKEYVFEIGGKSKNRKQIWQEDKSFTVIDNEIVGAKTRIPLWLFGFLY